MHKILSLVSLSVIFVSSLTSSSIVNQNQRTKYKRNSHPLDLVLGNPTPETDVLLLNVTIKKEKLVGRVIYDDLVFDERSYANKSLIGLDCPYNITAISIIHEDSYETSGYPIILFGGLGAPEAVILFVSQKGEGIHFSVRIWGRPYEVSDKNYSLIQGVPSSGDELLLFTNIMQTGQMGDSVTGHVVYEKPDNKNITITSVQAWDISVGCKLGGYPSVVEGGVGHNNAKIQISSLKYRGFQYHVLVFGNTQKYTN